MKLYKSNTVLVGLIETDPFNQLNAGSQVHAKVNERPNNALFLVLLLLQDKHGVVEELLQFFIGEVDTQLLHAVVLCWIHIQTLFESGTLKSLETINVSEESYNFVLTSKISNPAMSSTPM